MSRIVNQETVGSRDEFLIHLSVVSCCNMLHKSSFQALKKSPQNMKECRVISYAAPLVCFCGLSFPCPYQAAISLKRCPLAAAGRSIWADCTGTKVLITLSKVTINML